jgi:fermentation-respiration switch protein FrsA (DUF1100 family)
VDDEIVPFDHSVELYDLCKIKYPPLWVKGAGHNDLRTFGKQFYKLIQEYMENLSIIGV